MASKFKRLVFPLVLPVFLVLIINNYYLFSETPSSSIPSSGVVVPIEDAIGPESFAFDPLGGGPYTGVSDGRILKWQESERRWIDFAVTSPNRDACQGRRNGQHHLTEHICGRPLGLQFNKNNTGDLYIADAYMGLLVVGPEGGVAKAVATHHQHIPLRFTNSLDIDPSTGVVYFTDSSSQFPRSKYLSVILSGDTSGRLLRYDPASKETTLLVDNLSFPNGVALSKDGEFILFAETAKCRVLRYWIKTSKAGTLEVFSQLPGFPDNVKRSPREGYWVGIYSKRVKLVQWIISRPWIGNILLNKLPFDVMKVHSIWSRQRRSGMAVRLNENGDILESFGGEDGNRWISVSEVLEKDGKLWIGTINLPFAVRFNINFGEN
ncbi:hypothetical protein Tsubulata_004201 [Turnera subulata]|uniref:Strictosidine synthase conserved region domain-containing protein n=1 Tax=Turnera subulata TaxID=218843 RepID=A0A9Q0JCV4_9ROSI|nr:hypothetical protein Tsubulata_004201 [Turnera subulata]